VLFGWVHLGQKLVANREQNILDSKKKFHC